MIYEFNGIKPVVHESAFVHPQAVVTGHVVLGAHVYVGPGAAVRGDWGRIEVADNCNIQENCTLHMFPGKSVILREKAHIGHGAIVHGGVIGRNSMIGMNAVIMDDVEIGEECIVGALCFVKAKTIIPRRSLVVGNPGKIIREIDDEMIAWKTKGTEIYMGLPADLHATLKPCEPLREEPAVRPEQPDIYQIWAEAKEKVKS